MMKAYNYDTNGRYMGESDCSLDPLETENKGREVFLLPANATFVAVPEHDYITTFPCWNGSSWDMVPIPVPTSAEIAEGQIQELKSQLSASDYKIIKCAECSLAGLELPYDIVALNAERQTIRDQINTLEASIVTAT